jgi:Protein of unknown function (DUF2849).
MSRAPKIHVITANALIEGDVVYLTATEGWTRDLKAARAFEDQAEAEVALAKAAKRGGEVVGCYLAEVRLTAQGIEPTHFREDFRRRGPSNYAHGKQAAA